MRPRDHFEMRRNWVNAMQILPGSRQWRMQKRGERERQSEEGLERGSQRGYVPENEVRLLLLGDCPVQ